MIHPFITQKCVNVVHEVYYSILCLPHVAWNGNYTPILDLASLWDVSFLKRKWGMEESLAHNMY